MPVASGTKRIHLWRMGSRSMDASAMNASQLSNLSSLDASRDETAAAWMRWNAEQSAAVNRAKWALSQAYVELNNERPPPFGGWGPPGRWGLYASLESVGSEIQRLHRENARLASLVKHHGV